MECEWNINGTEKEVVEAPTYAVSHSRKIFMAVQKSSAPMCVQSAFNLWIFVANDPSDFLLALLGNKPCPKWDWTSYCMSATSPCHGCSLWARLRNCGSEQEMWQPWRPAQGSQFAAPEELNSGWCGCGADHKSFINHSYPWPQNPTPSSIRAESACCGQDPSLCSTRTKQIQICLVVATQPEKRGKQTIKNNLTFVRGFPRIHRFHI